ncbi:Probable U3 small nucleolar RNA-associated protein 11 [Gryllus bimaculatus]|nr:Probable U3 small nucleolar RNA-associated protein 11 [Gryllus bimaculatus]
MATWKSAAKCHRRIHQERHQPESRAHLGLLEKHKDYKERAKNFQNKKNTILALKRKALDRNPDEFYFHMINSKVEDGVHHELDKEDEHTPEQISLMQTQDLRYVRMKRTIESKKISKMQSQLHLIDVANKTENKHIFFVDSTKEAKQFDVATHLDTHPSLLKRRTNRLKTSTLQQLSLPNVTKPELERAAMSRDNAYRELSRRIEREKQLQVIEEKLAIKRYLQNKKEMAPERVKPATKSAPPVYKWQYDRKR